MIDVKVNQSDFDRIMRALDGVERVVLSMKDSIPEESAREFSEELTKNIITQKFGDFGKPHKNWKKGFANVESYWLFLGTALKSIRPTKISGTSILSKWFVGFTGYSGDTTGRPPVKKIVRNRLDLIKERVRKHKTRIVKTTNTLTPDQLARIGKPYVPPSRSTSQSLGGGSSVNFGSAGPRIIKRTGA